MMLVIVFNRNRYLENHGRSFQFKRVPSHPSKKLQILRVSSWLWSTSRLPDRVSILPNLTETNDCYTILFLILYQGVKFHLAEHSSMSKKMYTNTNKNGKADTLRVFALCKLNFLPLETELLVQVVVKCCQLLCGNIDFETGPWKEGRRGEK